MTSASKEKLHYKPIVDILTEEKYLGVGFEILDTDKKEILQQAAKEKCLACNFIFQSDRNRYGRLIEELEND